MGEDHRGDDQPNLFYQDKRTELSEGNWKIFLDCQRMGKFLRV